MESQHLPGQRQRPATAGINYKKLFLNSKGTHHTSVSHHSESTHSRPVQATADKPTHRCGPVAQACSYLAGPDGNSVLRR